MGCRGKLAHIRGADGRVGFEIVVFRQKDGVSSYEGLKFGNQ